MACLIIHSYLFYVSTHSRLKAAGFIQEMVTKPLMGFNTQPPEGGWVKNACFKPLSTVSTHSRLKAAGHKNAWIVPFADVSTHSRLKAAGKHITICDKNGDVSTHSRLKAAGWRHQ